MHCVPFIYLKTYMNNQMSYDLYRKYIHFSLILSNRLYTSQVPLEIAITIGNLFSHTGLYAVKVRRHAP